MFKIIIFCNLSGSFYYTLADLLKHLKIVATEPTRLPKRGDVSKGKPLQRRQMMKTFTLIHLTKFPLIDLQRIFELSRQFKKIIIN